MSWVWHKKRKTTLTPDWNALPVYPQADRLNHLYGWERRCRGHDVFNGPVRLEPPFVPYLPLGSDVGYSVSQCIAVPAAPDELAFCTLRLPVEQRVSVAAVESLLSILRGLSSPISFEIIADASEILFQLGASTTEYEDVAALFKTHFPHAEVENAPDALRSKLARYAGEKVGYQVVDFGLKQFAYLPLRSVSSFAADPLAGIVASLSHLQGDEVTGLQILFVPAREPWPESLALVAAEFSDAREVSSHRGPSGQASRKLDSPLFACIVRVFAVSLDGQDRAFSLCRRVGGALEVLSEPDGNALLALDNENYPDEDHFSDVLERTSSRCGMLLSTRELMALVHPPSENLLHPKLVRLDKGERALPEHLASAEGAMLGLHSYRNEAHPVVWPDAFRNRHLYMLGATRMGKSTLLLNMIAQDLEAGRGLCLIDPHGDLALDVLRLLPSERAGDALYLDFADREHPVSMGLLEAGGDWEKRLLCSDVLSILRRLFASSWGDRLEHILRHALQTLLAQPGHTLRDIRPLLSNKSYREKVLSGVRDPDLLSFWHGEFGSYTPATFAPIYNKLGLLLSSPIVRNIVVQKESKLDLSSLMRERKILLVNLNSGLIGEDNAHFLGALLVSKIQIAAMQSLRHSREERTPFTLYVDEFQNFVVSSFEKILSEAGKAGLSLVMANQFLEQLGERLQTAILSNAGTLVSFRVSSDSARLLEREFAGLFPQEKIVSLSRGESIVRLGTASDSLFVKTLPPPEPTVDDQTEAILIQTRERCCRTRAEVEAEMARDERERSTSGKAALDEQEGRGDEDAEQKTSPKSRGRKTTGSPDQEGLSDAESQEAATVAQPLLEPEMFGLSDD